MDKLFRIGDMARLFHTSMSSLRHYEALGLLTPETVDSHTGYRYYSVRQFEVLNTIRYLRALDMPLSDIADFLQNRNVERIEEKLLQQKKAVVDRQQELKRVERKIDNRLRQIRDAKNSVIGVISGKQLPACRLAWVSQTLQIHHFLDMEAPIRKLEQAQREASVFLGKVGVSISAEKLNQGCFDQYDGLFLMLDEEDSFSGPTMRLPCTPSLSVRFCGGHAEAPEQYRRLMAEVRARGLTVSGFSREITMIDYGLTSDPQKFVTEISLPVAEKRNP